MAENKTKEKKPFAEKVYEVLQWLVLGGLYLRKPGQASAPDGQERDKDMPGWLLGIIAPFTDEDEVVYAQLLDTTDDDIQKKVDKFRLELIANGWDEDIFRLRLVKNFKDAIEKKAVPDNSATKTLTQLANSDGDYLEQERIALSKKLLVKVAGRKKFWRWVITHKLEMLVGIFLVPIGIIEFTIFLFS